MSLRSELLIQIGRFKQRLKRLTLRDNRLRNASMFAAALVLGSAGYGVLVLSSGMQSSPLEKADRTSIRKAAIEYSSFTNREPNKTNGKSIGTRATRAILSERQSQPSQLKIAVLGVTSGQILAQVSSSLPMEEELDGPAYLQDALASGGLAPAMVQVPSGKFLMGSTPSEIGHVKNEAPQYEVQVEQFSISVHEVTETQFQKFLQTNGVVRQGPCDVYLAGAWSRVSDLSDRVSWLSSGDEPAICITWQQANSYVSWLSDETGEVYRLPSEQEWEYAARAGTTTAFSFGDDAENGCKHMNGADQSAEQTYKQLIGVSCNDGFSELAPVGSLQPNAFGLYDMHGNVWEWTGSPWTDSHEPGVLPDETRVIKGGSWFSYPMWLRSANRNAWDPNMGRADVGFRVVRDIPAGQ